MKILKGLGMYWHPNVDPSGKHDCNFSNRNLQLSATLAKRLCRGGVLMVSASCIPFYIHVQLAVMSGFLVVQHAQIKKSIPRRFCIKQNNQRQILKGVMINVSTAPSQQSLTLPVQ
jgi:hypothetical protein